MRPDLEDYDELTMGSGSGRAQAMSWLVLLVAIGGFTSLAYYAYKSGSKAMRDTTVTVVEADKTPIKTAPEDAQGEQFPNKDKTIYDAIEQGGKSKTVEKLMPEAERPVMPESAEDNDLAAEDNTKAPATTYVNNAARTADTSDKSTAPAKPAQPTLNVTSPKPDATPKDTATAAPAQTSPSQPEMVNVKPVTVTSKPTSEVKDEQAKAKPVEPPKPVAIALGGAYKIQLGAYQSEGEAAAQWKRISTKNSDVVSGAPIIVKADTPKGTFYRLRAAGFATMDAAKAACAKLAARKQACFPAGK